MRKMATQEAVFAAARQLVAEGREASSRAVRDALGGGSLATIQRYLRAWRGDGPLEEEEESGVASMPAAPAAVDHGELHERLDDIARAIIGLRTDLAMVSAPAMEAGAGEGGSISQEIATGLEKLDDVVRAMVGLRAEMANFAGQRAQEDGAPLAARMSSAVGAEVSAIVSDVMVEGFRGVIAVVDQRIAALSESLASHEPASLAALRELAEIQRDLLSDLSVAVREATLTPPPAPPEPAADPRVGEVLELVGQLKMDLRLATLSMKPLQDEVARLRGEREKLLQENARLAAEREAAVAETAVLRQLVLLQSGGEDNTPSGLAAGRA